MNIRYLVLSILGLILSHSSCKSSQVLTTEKNKEQITADPKEEKSLLWEITGNDLTHSSYLFGTIHIIEGDDYFLPPGTLTAIDASKQLIFEIDMADMNDPMKLMPLLQQAYMKGDTTLKDLVTSEDYKIIEGHFKELGLPLFFLERIKPMFLTVFATGDFDPKDIQSGKVKSYEMEFAKMAEEGNKTTGGLETIEYQIGVFDAIPYTDQANMLVETIKSSSTEDDTFKKLVDLYIDQDISGLYELMKQDDSIEEYEDVLLNTRNKNWIPLMKAAMQEKITFFAVGAGHLGGKKGVLNLLRQEGYTVKAFKG